MLRANSHSIKAMLASETSGPDMAWGGRGGMSASSPLSELAGTSPDCDPAVHLFRSALVWSHSPLVW